MMMEQIMVLIRDGVARTVFLCAGMRVGQMNGHFVIAFMIGMRCGRPMQPGAKHGQQNQSLEHDQTHHVPVADE